MCITVLMWQAHPVYPFLLLFNRDEYHSRPTKALEWWEGGEILGGKDEMAGGTWLASSKNGKFAFLTNFREIPSVPQAKSRGSLPVCFLQAERLGHNFKELLEKYGEGELPMKEMVDKLMLDTTKKDQNLLPKIFPFEMEYSSSSIFVDAERHLGRFGTTSTSAVSVKSIGEVYFYERHLENEMWKEQTVTYQIEK